MPVTITSPTSALTGSITSQVNVLCFGNSTGSVTIAASGGIGPYQYSLNGGSYQASDTFTALAAGTYVVMIQDDKLCTYSVDVVITGPAASLTGSITAQTNVSCFGSNNGSVTAAGAGGTAPYTYSINGGVFQASGIFAGLAPGSHSITVQDANSCTVALPVSITEPVALSLSAVSSPTECPGDPGGSITLSITGGSQPYNVIWSDGITTPDRNNIPDGSYSAVVTDVNGCASSVVVAVGFTGSESCLEVQEIITPNNDGFNDTWKIKNIALFPKAEVFVFNRWGKRVFSSKNVSADEWDGSLKGKTLPTDSYHYILHLNDGSEPRSGVVSIIR